MTALIAIAAVALGGFAFAGIAVGLGMRYGAAKGSLTVARADLEDARSDRDRAVDELGAVRNARDKEVDALSQKLKLLRGKIATLPNTPGARHLVLDELDGLLQGEDEATADDPDG
jgi:hypothetical protein